MEPIMYDMTNFQEHHWDIKNTNVLNPKHHDWKTSTLHIIVMMPTLLGPNIPQHTVTVQKLDPLNFNQKWGRSHKNTPWVISLSLISTNQTQPECATDTDALLISDSDPGILPVTSLSYQPVSNDKYAQTLSYIHNGYLTEK